MNGSSNHVIDDLHIGLHFCWQSFMNLFMYGLCDRPFTIMFFLADDTLEISEQYPLNCGRCKRQALRNETKWQYLYINTLASATFMRKSRGQSELKTMFCESFSWQGKVPDLLPARKATFWPIQGWRTTGTGTKEEWVSWLWKGKCVTDAAVSTVLCAQVCAWSRIASEFYGASVAASL